MIDELLSRCEFPDGDGALHCAVSGGADSLALLVLACATKRRVHAFHVDHQLRENSATEAHVVADACARFGAEFTALTVSIKHGGNLEARARAARYDALPNDVLTGHTSDDLAETMLINLIRGAGLDGLVAMKTLNRPILSLRRTETHQLCEHLGIVTVEDASNRDPSFLRNRIRHEVLPLLNDVAKRDVVAVLTREASVVRDDLAVLEELVSGIDASDVRALRRLPPALARRALRRWLRDEVDGFVYPPSAAAMERMMAVVRGDVVGCELPGGRTVRRSGGRLELIERGRQ